MLYVARMRQSWGDDPDTQEDEDEDNGSLPTHVVVRINSETDFLDNWGSIKALAHAGQLNRRIGFNHIVCSMYPELRMLVVDADYQESFFADFLVPWLGSERAEEFSNQMARAGDNGWWRCLPEWDNPDWDDEYWENLALNYDYALEVVFPDGYIRAVHRGAIWHSPLIDSDLFGIVNSHGVMRNV